MICLLFLGNRTSLAAEEPTIVRAVLFYSPTCGHCEYVIVEFLPTVFDKYGDQLEMVGIDISTPEGSYLFKAALLYFGLDRGAVPFLIIGDQYLVGSVDIPEKFPDIIEEYLSQGGVDWPSVSELQEAMIAGDEASAEETKQNQGNLTPEPIPAAMATPAITETADENLVATDTPGSYPVATEPSLLDTGSFPTQSDPPDFLENLARDPLGNSIAVVILISIMVSFLAVGYIFFQRANLRKLLIPIWVVPCLCLVGIIVAGYLTYVETTQVEAVCGPVGECITVQQSEFARLFGFLPVGILGLVGYCLILCTWLVSVFGNKWVQAFADLILFALVLFGTLLSFYLTLLEPFVIGATCAWCLTSALIMTLLLWVTFVPAKNAFSSLRDLKNIWI